MASTLIKQSGKELYSVNEYITNSIDEMQKINLRGVSPGSTAIILNDDGYKKYMLSQDKIWKLMSSGSGSDIPSGESHEF